MNERSLKEWHYFRDLKCPKCNKQGILSKEDKNNTEYTHYWCPKEYDNNGCGWKGAGIGHPMYAIDEI